MAIHATLQAKAHEWIGQRNPDKLAAVVHLLEVMVNESVEPVTEEDRRRFSGRAGYLRRRQRHPHGRRTRRLRWKPEDFLLALGRTSVSKKCGI